MIDDEVNSKPPVAVVVQSLVEENENGFFFVLFVKKEVRVCRFLVAGQ
jgi:hypothetical protein